MPAWVAYSRTTTLSAPWSAGSVCTPSAWRHAPLRLCLWGFSWVWVVTGWGGQVCSSGHWSNFSSFSVTLWLFSTSGISACSLRSNGCGYQVAIYIFEFSSTGRIFSSGTWWSFLWFLCQSSTSFDSPSYSWDLPTPSPCFSRRLGTLTSIFKFPELDHYSYSSRPRTSAWVRNRYHWVCFWAFHFRDRGSHRFYLVFSIITCTHRFPSTGQSTFQLVIEFGLRSWRRWRAVARIPWAALLALRFPGIVFRFRWSEKPL